jgi:two-component system, chemotaxis family, sensor kinase CheA
MDKDSSQEHDFTMEMIVKELRSSFKEEAHELLVELENALLELEKTPGDKNQVERVFRAMHTLKGSSGACEFNDIVRFTHEIETVFDMVRNGKVDVTKELINLTLSARDQVKSFLYHHYEGTQADNSNSLRILTSFQTLLAAERNQRPTDQERHLIAQQKKHGVGLQTFRIRFRPHENIFVREPDIVQLFRNLRALGSCNIYVQTEKIPYLENINPATCSIYWDVILTTDRGIDAIYAAFTQVREHGELKVEVIDEEEYAGDKISYKNLGEILLDRGDLASDDLQKVLQEKKKVGEILVESGIVSNAKVESALLEQQHVREMREQRQAVDSNLSIRVPTEKLDRLVNLVGELVTVQARLSQTASTNGLPEILSIAEEVERLTENLRDTAMNIRMLPIGTTFNKFNRLVRDLSVELGKEIELMTEGAETELDKTVIERLGDPLIHIIRNSIGHGIEQPEIRVAAGKPKKGTIRLSALHSGAHVLIQVEDDGIGLDREAIRAKAIQNGLLTPDAAPTEKELFSLIFAAGFSTVEKVTDISGRGVGLDVVKKAIEQLHGTVEIQSKRGFGTTITLKLPLTLAIIEGLLVKIQKQYFVLPLSFVKECVELSALNKKNDRNRTIANVRGEIVPYIKLRELFEIEGERPGIEQIVITEINGSRVGFVVDTVIGSHQTVIKSLGTYYKSTEEISGATILGSGTVAMILDVPQLMRSVEHQETQMVERMTF